jgi:hypothetical protein
VGGVAGVAVMSVDLGSEWMKVAVVSVSIFKLQIVVFVYFTAKSLIKYSERM